MVGDGVTESAEPVTAVLGMNEASLLCSLMRDCAACHADAAVICRGAGQRGYWIAAASV